MDVYQVPFIILNNLSCKHFWVNFLSGTHFKRIALSRTKLRTNEYS